MQEWTFPIRRLGVLVKAVIREAGREGAITSQPFSAYLDSGASDTMLDHGLVSTLRLPAAREVALSVLGREDASFHETYAVEVALAIPDGRTTPWARVEALAGPVYPTGAVAALGRDFLVHFVFIYDGPARRATLRW